MGSPPLAEILLAGGRHRVGPMVEEYLGTLHRSGDYVIEDSAAGFTLLYGLVIEDMQIRALLGEPAPTPKAIRSHAVQAVETFLSLSRPDV